MARKPKPLPEIVDANIDQEKFDVAAQSLNTLSLMNAEARENALALADELGYEGELSADGLENEIRFYQRRSVEAVLELGKRLLILKELTPHGEFLSRAENLGFSARMTQRFMSATLKFSNATSMSLLKSAGTHTKLLELVVLDDAEIEALETGDSVRGLTLDEIETMSVRELKAALRETKADLDSSRKSRAEKDEEIQNLKDSLNKKLVKKISPDEEGKQIRAEASQIAYAAEAEIRGNLRLAFQELEKHAEEHQLSHEDFMAGLVCQIEQALNQLRGEFHIKAEPDDEEIPAWLRGETSEEA